MKFLGLIRHDATKHKVKKWASLSVKDVEAKFVCYEDAGRVFYNSPVLWAHVTLIEKEWSQDRSEPLTEYSSQVIQTLDINNEYTHSYLIMNTDGDKLIVTCHGRAGFGSVYDISICYIGKQEFLDHHLNLLNIDYSEIYNIQRKG